MELRRSTKAVTRSVSIRQPFLKEIDLGIDGRSDVYPSLAQKIQGFFDRRPFSDPAVPRAHLRKLVEGHARQAWFKDLPAELRQLTEGTATTMVAAASDDIARVGDPISHWYGLMRGYLQMYVVGPEGTETTLFCLSEGGWIGDGTLLKKERMRYGLRAITAAQVCRIPVETFDTLRRSSIDFNHFLCTTLNERMGMIIGMLVASRLVGPEMSVARAILMLSDPRCGCPQELAISQRTIALVSGLSRQRVNAAIGIFNERGFVRSQARKGTLVVNGPLLRRYAMDERPKRPP